MRQRIACVVVLVLGCGVGLSQEPGKAQISFPTRDRITATVPVEALQNGSWSFGNRVSFDRPTLEEQAMWESRFVWADGAARMSVLGGLVPVPGGGASGCFNVDLPERIGRIRDFILRLKNPDSPQEAVPGQPYPLPNGSSRKNKSISALAELGQKIYQ